MARSKNPRRVVLPVLRAIKSNATDMVRIWGGPASERGEDGKHWVTAPAERQPENTPDDWDRLATYMAIVARQATEVQEYARRQSKRLRAEPAAPLD
jgi:hypothetical protein